MNSLQSYEDTANGRATLGALQAYARVLGAYRAALAPPQKHWWHISLLPGKNDFGTGRLAHGDRSLELTLNFRNSFVALDVDDRSSPIPLSGQSATELHREIASRFRDQQVAVNIDPGNTDSQEPVAYDAASARTIGDIFHGVAEVFDLFKTRVYNETSPVQLWPHHFDLAVLLLTGKKIPGKDPANEEQSDEQINFGFLFGDAAITEPYFYVTYYPAQPGPGRMSWEPPATWYSGDFEAAIVRYRDLVGDPDPAGRLLKFWNTALNRGLETINPNRTNNEQ